MNLFCYMIEKMFDYFWNLISYDSSMKMVLITYDMRIFYIILLIDFWKILKFYKYIHFFFRILTKWVSVSKKRYTRYYSFIWFMRYAYAYAQHEISSLFQYIIILILKLNKFNLKKCGKLKIINKQNFIINI